MKKTILIVVGACLLILAALSLAAAITVTGSGFLDLSNIARAVFFLAGAAFCGLGLFALKAAKKSGQ